MEIFMKRAGRITYALMSFAMLFATTAFAANKGSLHVQYNDYGWKNATARWRVHSAMGRRWPRCRTENQAAQQSQSHGTRQSDTAGPAAQRRCGSTGHRRQRRPEVARDQILRQEVLPPNRTRVDDVSGSAIANPGMLPIVAIPIPFDQPGVPAIGKQSLFVVIININGAMGPSAPLAVFVAPRWTPAAEREVIHE